MKKQNNPKKEAPEQGHTHCDHVYKRCCKDDCGRWVNKGGHGQFLGIVNGVPSLLTLLGGDPFTSPLTVGLGESKDAEELKNRNLSNPEPASAIRPADDSVSQAIGRLTAVK